jgi:hypothetical protein
VTTKLNHDYTVTCTDGGGRTVSFRDITGSDLEYLATLLCSEDNVLSSNDVIGLLQHLSVPSRDDFSRLIPYAIRALYREVQSHILKNYMPKEIWLRQCYAVQNGSFQNTSSMELVPMSKFVAMCQIHKEAMDEMNPNKMPLTPTET